ncbi:cephalosporin hydroxylase family protein [Chlamydiota bacterium]
MKIIIDTSTKTLITETNKESRTIDLFSKEAFGLISQQWVKVGWEQKYPYTFTWMGRPIIQLPEDMLRMQEVIYNVKPDVIIETGIAHGGSLIFYASLCSVLNKGRVIGVDIEIRTQNRKAIESHEMFPLITLIEGDSTSLEVFSRIKSLIKSNEKVLIILDSCHSRKHVLAELERYNSLVTPDSYIIATDGIMKDLYNVPNGSPEWQQDNPVTAINDFISKHPEFVIEEPEWTFNESKLTNRITHWPCAFLRKKLT